MRTCLSPPTWSNSSSGRRPATAGPSTRPRIASWAASGDVRALVIPGLRAAVLLAQASTHLWHGRHEDVGSLLDEALAEAEREGPPGIELEVLGMMAFVEQLLVADEPRG